jgi:hypothetical protein
MLDYNDQGNLVGSLSEEAADALEQLAEQLSENEQHEAWTCDEWFSDQTLDDLGIGANTTDAELRSMAERYGEDAESDGVLLIDDVYDYLERCRWDARDLAEEDPGRKPSPTINDSHQVFDTGGSMKLKTFTIDDIRQLEPCYDPAKYLPEDWMGTALDILRVTDCPPEDRLWVVCHEGWIDDKTLRLIGIGCARSALAMVDNPDPRSIAACNAAERYTNGEATVEELDAARAAAWAAAWDEAEDATKDIAIAKVTARVVTWDAIGNATWIAAGAAAMTAARAAAGDEAKDAGWDTAWNAQIAQIVHLIETLC